MTNEEMVVEIMSLRQSFDNMATQMKENRKAMEDLLIDLLVVSKKYAEDNGSLDGFMFTQKQVDAQMQMLIDLIGNPESLPDVDVFRKAIGLRFMETAKISPEPAPGGAQDSKPVSTHPETLETQRRATTETTQ